MAYNSTWEATDLTQVSLLEAAVYNMFRDAIKERGAYIDDYYYGPVSPGDGSVADKYGTLQRAIANVCIYYLNESKLPIEQYTVSQISSTSDGSPSVKVRYQNIGEVLAAAGYNQSGFTRKYSREIGYANDTGAAGQVARCWYANGGLKAGAIYRHNGTTWVLHEDQTTPPDIITDYGFINATSSSGGNIGGDYIGPWIFEEMRAVLKKLKILCAYTYTNEGTVSYTRYAFSYGRDIWWNYSWTYPGPDVQLPTPQAALDYALAHIITQPPGSINYASMTYTEHMIYNTGTNDSPGPYVCYAWCYRAVLTYPLRINGYAQVNLQYSQVPTSGNLKAYAGMHALTGFDQTPTYFDQTGLGFQLGQPMKIYDQTGAQTFPVSVTIGTPTPGTFQTTPVNAPSYGQFNSPAYGCQPYDWQLVLFTPDFTYA